ncbi:porin family protein [Adhaeribacter soli]|uniref:PorT family protein n=1 Tax=Adhaeribacter soli TaxID=2607655 RepID=A0A5N1J1E1_9BACT|nr:porin family protein [Adhaeribacter soli]KAA9340244.1 PorT family protein [Adhaeribacter soli]
MKKALPVLAFLFGIMPFLASAQSEGVGPYIGAAAAINNTWIIIDNELQNNEHHDHKATFGPAGGLVLGYKFNDRHSLQLEGAYSKQGAKYDLLNSDNRVIGKKEIDLKYLAVPLLFKLSGTGTTRFNIHVGPQVAFLLSGEEVNTFDENVVVSNPNMPNNGQTIPAGTYTISDKDPANAGVYKLNNIAPSIVLGFGVEHDLSDQLYLTANLRFNYSWTNINDDEVVAHPNDLDKYTLRYNVLGGLQVGLHYFFQKP